ncbi:MAG: MATE family efflux transporter [Bacteroidota bacterium]|nr:MATE family efflux transporter [Bacteroidota bacterium]
MEKQNNADELGVGKIGRLLLQYSIPAIIATAAASLYNIIDRIFIGQGVGPLAISGLALTFPLMNLAAAFGALVGIGASTMVSIRLGQKRHTDAAMTLANALMLNIVISIVYSIIMLIFLDNVLSVIGASPNTIQYAREFMQIILIGNVFTHIYMGMNNIMRSSGYPRKAMITTLITVAVNLVLAPLFIFVFKWGIRGAATATVCAQFVGTVMVLAHFIKKEHLVHFVPGYFKFKKKIVIDIFSIGMSNFMMLICATLIIVLLNRSLGVYGGDYAIGAYGIVNSILSIFVMVVIGLNQGMQPIAGYNFGAKQFPRVMKVYKYTIIAGTCITVLGFILGETIPHLLSRAFTTNDELVDMAVIGIRITVMMFPVVGFQVVTSSFFQSIAKAKISILLSLSRQVLFLSPALIILPKIFGLNGVWYSIPAADLSASVVTLIVLNWQLKKMRKTHYLVTNE